MSIPLSRTRADRTRSTTLRAWPCTCLIVSKIATAELFEGRIFGKAAVLIEARRGLHHLLPQMHGAALGRPRRFHLSGACKHDAPVLARYGIEVRRGQRPVDIAQVPCRLRESLGTIFAPAHAIAPIAAEIAAAQLAQAHGPIIIRQQMIGIFTALGEPHRKLVAGWQTEHRIVDGVRILPAENFILWIRKRRKTHNTRIRPNPAALLEELISKPVAERAHRSRAPMRDEERARQVLSAGRSRTPAGGATGLS